jgi:hypothetical protein
MFIISLDFELYWGVMDSRGEEYFNDIKKVEKIVPMLLELFDDYDVACTWATVGKILAHDFKELDKFSPIIKPQYTNNSLSTYSHWDRLKSEDGKLLFSPDLVEKIIRSKNQELSSHTFSHYYTLEKGQNAADFKSDLASMNKIMKEYSQKAESIIFPRNQINAEYLKLCNSYGYKCYRGNPSHWAYNMSSRDKNSLLKRGFRLIDTYIPLSGSLTQRCREDPVSKMVNVPASFFFRPFNNKLRFLEPLKILRIKRSMLHAAKKGKLFHLWWHPHNFGKNTETNMMQLKEILDYYSYLNGVFGFESVTVCQAASKYLELNDV